ncbi:extracellular solute-binding protein [Streptomyces roseirectus]|uniref:extracellular solute-binding protein n=1 Tax=Streptomyces roseirectus TaxID=2768066 RepID=UPI001FE9E800|nr:extracellular solute-binding protein [Streptomyces roseirectus]
MPRSVRPLLAGFLAFAALAACTESAPPAGPVDPEPDTIVVASGRDVTDGIRQRLIDAWNARQGAGGVKARLVELPGSADQQRSQLLGALQSGSAHYDVVNLDVTWVPEFAAAGLVRRLPEEAVSEAGDLIGTVDGTSFWGGERYAVPFNSDVGLLYYRRDQVGELKAGAGWGWDELAAVIDGLSRKSPPGWKAGWTTQLAPYEGRTVNAVEAFASAVEGLRITDERGRYQATEEQLASGVAELRRRTTSAYVLGDAYTSNEDDSLSDFTQGRTSFLRNWPYAYPSLRSAFKDDLGVAPLPGKAVLGGQNLAMTRSVSEEKADKTVELIRFLTDADSERCLLQAGFAATRESAYGEAARCTHVAPSAGRHTAESAVPWTADQVRFSRDILLPALRTAVQRPRTPLYGAVTQTLIDKLSPLFDPRADPSGVAEALHEALGEELP